MTMFCPHIGLKVCSMKIVEFVSFTLEGISIVYAFLSELKILCRSLTGPMFFFCKKIQNRFCEYLFFLFSESAGS